MIHLDINTVHTNLSGGDTQQLYMDEINQTQCMMGVIEEFYTMLLSSIAT